MILTNIVKSLTKDRLRLLLFSTVLFTFVSCNVDKSEGEGKTVFRYNQAGVLGSLDPAFATDQAIQWATSQLYNGLLELDSNLVIKPALATRWEISEDLKTYTFYIRKGVKFHDDHLFPNGKGRVVTAHDFEYSFKRICDPQSIYNKGIWIFKDKVLKNEDGNISDTCFRAVNDTVFKIYLEQPAPYFLQILTMNYTFVIPHEVAEHYGQNFRSHPVGTGPFKFKSWDEGNTLVLLKNDNYWKKDENGTSLPYLDAVQVYFIPDKSQAFRAFTLGDIDFVSGIEQSSIDEFLYSNGDFKEDVLQRYAAQKCDYLNTEYIGIQLDPNAPVYQGQSEHPLWNVSFRQALNYAIDKKRLVTHLRNGLGNAGVHGVVPPAVPYFETKEVRGYEFNSQKAIEAFKASGWRGKSMPELKFFVDKEYKGLGEFMCKSWEEILGINVKLAINESKVIRGMANNGEIAMFRASWLGDYSDAENYLALFYGSNFTPNGPNKTHYQDDQFDSLYVQSKKVVDPIERGKVYQKMDDLMMKDSPVIIMFYDEVIRLSQPNITGFPANAMNFLNLERLRKNIPAQ